LHVCKHGPKNIAIFLKILEVYLFSINMLLLKEKRWVLGNERRLMRGKGESLRGRNIGIFKPSNFRPIAAYTA